MMTNPSYTTASLSSWLANIKADDIDGGLAADFDGSLSGLGVELGSSTYNMSEALLALPVFKQETVDAGFQYVLCAATSPATKLYDETLTYLNQGQSYAVKVKKLGDLGHLRGRYLRSVIRVMFHERRLQYNEREQLDFWRQTRPGERIVDVDIPLSYGLVEMKIHKKKLNCVEFVWDPQRDTGIYIKIHAISTEFTPRKHGGEKGVPFRLQVETYLNDEYDSRLLYAASCQVKVFKPKGADRKLKTDREKLEKRTVAEKEKYQPSYECTVLIEIPSEQMKGYLEQIEQEEQLYETDTTPPTSVKEVKVTPRAIKNSTRSEPSPTTTQLITASTTPPSVFSTVSDLAILLDQSSSDSSSRQSASVTTSLASDPVQVEPLSPKATAQEVTQWLHNHRFSGFVKVFQSFSGADLLRLSREDLIQICGLADGIRLNNSLQSRTVRPKLTIYIYQARGITIHSLERLQMSPPPCIMSDVPSHNNKLDLTSPRITSPVTVVTSDISSRIQDASPMKAKSPSPTHSKPPCMTDAFIKPKVKDPKMIREATANEPRTECSGQPPGVSNCPVEVIGEAVGSGTSKRSSGGSMGGQGWKRQYREAEESDTEIEVNTTKKQRTRTLELSRKGVYHAVYLEYLTLKHLKDKLAASFSIGPQQIQEIHVQGPSGIHILVTDNVVQNFTDDSRYNIEAREDDIMLSYYNILLQTATSS